MSNGDNTLTLKPKEVFINVILIPSIKLAQTAVYNLNGNISPLQAVRPLKGVIGSLNQKGKKDLEEILQRLKEIEDDPRTATRIEMEGIYEQIMNYLHETYLKEYDRGISEIDFEQLDKQEE